MDSSDESCGILAGGADNGNVFVWDPAKIIKKEDALIQKMTKHSGAVTALDSNPFQVCAASLTWYLLCVNIIDAPDSGTK